MDFNNIMNLFTSALRSRGKKIPHYNISSSITTSESLGAVKLFFDIKELQPGQLSYPYHFHSDNEEVFIIIDGEATLRQNNNCKILEKGDLVFFPNSEKGAHQLFNHTNKIVRYLDLTTRFGTDICAYPDSGKVNIGDGGIYKMKDKVDYFYGEEDIPDFWNHPEKL